MVSLRHIDTYITYTWTRNPFVGYPTGVVDLPSHKMKKNGEGTVPKDE